MTAIHTLTAFQKKLQDDISRAVSRMLERRRVTGIDGARIRTVGYDPRDTADRPLRWLRPEVDIGDDVLTVRHGTDEIVLGAFRRGTDDPPNADIRSRLAALETALEQAPGPVVPFHWYKQDQLATSAVNTLTSLGQSFVVTVPDPGQYRVNINHFAAQVKRNVDDGGSELSLELDGSQIVNAQLHTTHYTNVPVVGDALMTGGGVAVGYGATRVVTTQIANQWLGFTLKGTGRSTAGTTYWSGIVVSGWYQRIG